MDLSFLEQLLGDPIEEETGFRNVWVVAIAWEDFLRPCDVQVVGKARALADSLGAYVNALLVGEQATEAMAQDLIAFGADTVYWGPGYPTGSSLVDFVNRYQPQIILFADAAGGRKMAPRLAQRLNTALVTHTVDLSINTESGTLLAATPIFHGAAYQVVECLTNPKIATVQPGVFPLPHRDNWRTGTVENIELIWKPQPPLVPVTPPETYISLDRAEIIVAGGRGMAAAGWQLVEELAGALARRLPHRRIAVAGSRGAADEGWINGDHMVDLTGHRVSPDLYIACGIWGHFEHFAATEKSRCVVAVNRNPAAPILHHADYGIVGDVAAVIPALIAALDG